MNQASRSRNRRTAEHPIQDRNTAVLSAVNAGVRHPDPLTTIAMRNVAPDDHVADVIATARRENLIIVTNGQRFALCSVIPAGWRSFGPREYAPPLMP
ncbi:hypothetical protein [Methyloversatilis sp.]|uniref:hypothetical protein n=1 Tax=Methyloversatilis sp. TaxID=2569862 RepID=UPI002732A00C|nr:hypothetical protein [Methyloversatilis sp.]MDP2869668.1 hypothetical protein [Methyloversatilis sp.]MDP3455013.1 hypothetical protein [Methyloversatilis sp.]MDP3576847.1 hypothetical protein [Methyloversatilis sp.]